MPPSDLPPVGLAGKLLVAAPQLADPNFTRTVVLVLEHDQPGAVGVVLNRPMHVGVGELLGVWEDLAAAAPPGVVFSGGPVSPDAVIGLAEPAGGAAAVALADDEEGGDPGGAPTWRAVLPGVAVVDLSVAPPEQPVPLGGARLFSGYAGWDAGQLEEEIADGGWYVLDAVPGDALGDAPERLWHDVLHRQGGRMAMLATYPPTPAVN